MPLSLYLVTLICGIFVEHLDLCGNHFEPVQSLPQQLVSLFPNLTYLQVDFPFAFLFFTTNVKVILEENCIDLLIFLVGNKRDTKTNNGRRGRKNNEGNVDIYSTLLNWYPIRRRRS